MKGSTITGLVTGMAIGAAALGAYGMMSRSDRNKMRSIVMRTGQRMTDKANEFMGK